MPLLLIERYTKMIKVLSLFSGIGAFEKALNNLDIPFELVGFSEIDKYAAKSYCAIHDVNESQNLGDITKIDEKALPKDIDIVTYGFPCQDISLAGKQKGLFDEDGSKTRSGLFFEALRIIEETQPKIAIAENVKNLVGKKFKAQFELVLQSLEQAGYNNYWNVLNAKDYGIPQNRERVFIVSIRKDIDNGIFEFPKQFPLELRLKDLLEDEVDEKYYLEGKYENITKVNDNYSVMNGGVIGKMHDISRRAYSEDSTAPTIPTCAGGNIQPKVIVHDKTIKVGNIYPSGGQNGNVYDEEGLSPTIVSGETNTKGNGGIGSSNAPKILVREATKKGYTEAHEGDSINFEQPNSKTRRGRVGKQVAQTLTTSPQQGGWL